VHSRAPTTLLARTSRLSQPPLEASASSRMPAPKAGPSKRSQGKFYLGELIDLAEILRFGVQWGQACPHLRMVRAKHLNLPPWTLNPTPHTIHTTPYTLHPTPYTPNPTYHTIHPTPGTSYLTPYALHPTPHPLHPTPYTSYPAPYTLHSTSYTPHSKSRPLNAA
jgi:hypothetical protein